jgi:hypothetical protein
MKSKLGRFVKLGRRFSGVQLWQTVSRKEVENGKVGVRQEQLFRVLPHDQHQRAQTRWREFQGHLKQLIFRGFFPKVSLFAYIRLSYEIIT